jgi:rhamnosyltransferase subunit B
MLTRTGKRIVITTYGSFGDIHPYIALALALKKRGHRPLIATSGIYREKIEPLGIEFHAARPELPGIDKLDEIEELMRRGMDARRGPEFIVRDMFVTHVRASYEDLSEAVRGADLLITHPITFAGPLVAEKNGLPWVSSVLSPVSLFSVYDPPVAPQAPSSDKVISRLPTFVIRLIFKLARYNTARWFEPLRELRRELGLPSGGHPLFEGQHSPALVLALFSKLLTKRQPDWPTQTRVTGFCFYDRRDETEEGQGLTDELREFLDAGTPPLVFTLGSAAVWNAGDFYRESVAAAKILGERAVLLIGDARNLPHKDLPEGIRAFDYAPYGELLPRASCIVHQGGIGTTGQSMRAGRPMLVMPYSHDQPDNARSVVRLGMARTLPRQRYKAERVAQELSALLSDPSYADRAAEVGRYVRSEDGPGAACDLIESLLFDRVDDEDQNLKEEEIDSLVH